MPREYYQLSDIQDLGELNRIFDSISRRLNYLADSGDNLSAGDQRIVNQADAIDDQDSTTKAQFGILLQLNFGPGQSVEVLGTADEITVVETGSGTYTVGIADPLIVAKGGTGLATITDHVIMLGSGTDAITLLAVATHGQLPIGATGADPVLATLTGTAGQITITNAAGSITISIPSGAAITFANEGVHILDTNASHDLVIKAGSDLTADRILTLTTGDAARIITLSGNPTLDDWFDQAVKVASNVIHADLDLTGRISWNTLTVTTGVYDALDVSGVNTLFIDTSGGNVTLGGTINGVDGQVLMVVVHDSTGNTTVENVEGTGNQDFYLHAGADETLTAEPGGWVFVNMGGNHWHDASHAKHV